MFTSSKKLAMFMLWIALVITSCSVSIPKNCWDFRLDNKRIGRIAINPNTASVLISDSRDSRTLYYYSNPDFIQPPTVINLEVGVLKACITDTIWIVTNSRSLISYSLVDNSITNYPNIDSYGPISTCTVSNDNQLMIWGQSWFAFYKGHWVYENLNDKNINIAYVAKDDNGQIWLLTQQGDIFYLTVNKEWQQFGQVQVKENAHWLSITDQILWLYVDNELFKWSISENTPVSILSLSAEDYALIDVQKDNYGSFWVLGYTGIWVVKDLQVERLPLPENKFSIMHAAFYLENDMIFAGNVNGLFGLDVKEVSSSP